MIGWLREEWPLVAGAGIPLVALITLAVLNPAAALRLASSLSGWLLDLLRGFVEWLRKPRTGEQKWRITCMTLGIVCLLASFVAWDARKTIVVIREKCAAQVREVEGKVVVAKREVVGAQHEVKACRATLTAEVGKRQAIEKLAAEAVQQAQRDEAAAEKKLADWQAEYAKRPKGCDEALVQMEAQCAAVPNN